MRSKSVLIGFAGMCALLAAAAPGWARDAGQAAAAVTSTQTPVAEYAEVGHHAACHDWREQIGTSIEQFRQRCAAELASGRLAACEAEQHRITQSVVDFNGQCGR